MCGCRKAHMNPKVCGCEDARIQASTHEPQDMIMQGVEDINMRIQESIGGRPEESKRGKAFLAYIY